MISPEQRPRQSETMTGKDLGEEYLFYDASGDSVHVLNGTAREIYLLCDGTRCVTDLVQLMVDRYDVEGSEVRKDVETVLNELTDLGLLKLS